MGAATVNTFAEMVGGWVAARFRRGPRFRRLRRDDGEFEACGGAGGLARGLL